MIGRVVFFILSFLLLVYLILPGPSSIDSFSGLPGSLKSIEPGDTVQVPQVAAYYSTLYRLDVMSFYLSQFKDLIAVPLPPLRLNFPPEYAYTAIKDQTRSTYLEEIVYPLRDSLFINGFEPFYQNGQPKYPGATDIVVDDVFFHSKATLRYYGSPVWIRIVVWVGINFSFVLLWKVSRKILNDE